MPSLAWACLQASEESAHGQTRVQRTLDDLGNDCPVLIGIAVKWSRGGNSIETVTKQIEAARQLGVKGIVLFHGTALTEEYLNTLRTGVFQRAAE